MPNPPGVREGPTPDETAKVTHTRALGAAFRLEQLMEEREIELAGEATHHKAHRARLARIDQQIAHERHTLASAHEHAVDGPVTRELHVITVDLHHLARGERLIAQKEGDE
jgi:hypothetical protein